MIERVLLIPHIKIHNANALSSPFTIGFPAMTAWLGFVHALQRKLNKAGLNEQFNGVGVVCHTMDLHTYKGSGDFTYSIVGTANPVDKDGSRSAFIEEARCHLDVSLLIDFTGINKAGGRQAAVIEHIEESLLTMKIAGGDILSFQTPKPFDDYPSLCTKLMPGYALIERRDLMVQTMEEGEDALSALLDYLSVHHHSQKNEGKSVRWTSQRKTSGWIVPVATGFQGITELGTAKNQRDPDVPHRFAESVVTLGEFKMPYRMNSLGELLWQYHVDSENSLYLCQQETASLLFSSNDDEADF